MRWTRLVTAALLSGLVVVMLAEESQIFFPSPFPQGDWQPGGLQVEDAWLKSADGTRIHGWFVAHPSPAAVVLFCHGNAGNVTHRVDALKSIHSICRAAVLVVDYRGYGRSDGRPTEAGVLADARAGRQWLARRTGIAEGDVVLLGESIGGGVAVDLASSDGARALILESTFTSLPDVASYHLPWLPARLLMRTRFDSLAKIGRYRGPLFVSHGTADTIVPYRLGKRLFEAANEPKQFMSIDGADHNDLHARDYYVALAQFLNGLPATRPHTEAP